MENRLNSKFDGLISLEEAANLIGVTSDYLRAEIKRGKLAEGSDCKKIGKVWIVDKEKFIEKYGKSNTR